MDAKPPAQHRIQVGQLEGDLGQPGHLNRFDLQAPRVEVELTGAGRDQLERAVSREHLALEVDQEREVAAIQSIIACHSGQSHQAIE